MNMIKTKIKIIFEDGDTVSADNVHAIITDFNKFEENIPDKILINFTDKERGTGNLMVEKDWVKEFHIELYDDDTYIGDLN